MYEQLWNRFSWFFIASFGDLREASPPSPFFAAFDSALDFPLDFFSFGIALSFDRFFYFGMLCSLDILVAIGINGLIVTRVAKGK
jgi:hypothetical protein